MNFTKTIKKITLASLVGLSLGACGTMNAGYNDPSARNEIMAQAMKRTIAEEQKTNPTYPSVPMGIFAVPSNPGTNIQTNLSEDFPDNLKFNPHGDAVQFYVNKNGQITRESGRDNLNGLLKNFQVVDTPFSATFTDNLAPSSPERVQIQALAPRSLINNVESSNPSQLASVQPPSTNPSIEFEQPYIVHLTKGDTIWGIAKENRINYMDVLKDNNLTEEQARRLPVGFEVKIPGGTQIANSNNELNKVSYTMPKPTKTEVTKFSYAEVYKFPEPKSIDAVLSSDGSDNIAQIKSTLNINTANAKPSKLEDIAFSFPSVYSTNIVKVGYSIENRKISKDDLLREVSLYGSKVGISVDVFTNRKGEEVMRYRVKDTADALGVWKNAEYVAERINDYKKNLEASA